MSDSSVADLRKTYLIAGVAALMAGAAWICWAIINGATGGLLDSSPETAGLRVAKLGQLLIIGWNLLLVPAALVLWKRVQQRDPDRILLYTVYGILSLCLWAIGAAARINSPMLEVCYLLLSAVWWIGIGNAIRRRHRIFGTFTIVLGIFALLDATLSFFEPMPFYIYVLASPKLPLGIVWDFWLGYFLLTSFDESQIDKASPSAEISA
jgi:hypothetical protein